MKALAPSRAENAYGLKRLWAIGRNGIKRPLLNLGRCLIWQCTVSSGTHVSERTREKRERGLCSLGP